MLAVFSDDILFEDFRLRVVSRVLVFLMRCHWLYFKGGQKGVDCFSDDILLGGCILRVVGRLLAVFFWM